MSAPAATAEEKKSRRASLIKFTKKVKDIFKPESAGPSKPTPAAKPDTPATKPAETSTATKPAEPKAYDRATLQQERTRKLFEKYGLTLSENEWQPPASAPTSVKRVEKPIRMRVRRNCHRCDTVFGADKVCAKCEHKRCKKCPRYPKKPKEGAEKDKRPCAPSKPHEPVILTRGNRHFVKQINLMKYTCHECQTDFKPSCNACESCGHSRCNICPKSRAKFVVEDKGEEVELLPQVKRVYKKPRQRVRWICDSCNEAFLERSKTCEKCGHGRCEKCIRIPPKKVPKEPDPEVVASLQKKLAAVSIGDPGPTPTTT